MNDAPASRTKDVWIRASIGVLVVVTLVTVLIGFLWLPYGQTGAVSAGLWDAFCRAVGVAEPFRPAQQPTTPIFRPSNVIVTADMLETTESDAIGRGATLALRCTMCHGARGMSEANSPNLAGQDGGAIYKQLRDFGSGHRESAVMVPLMRNLNDREMRDLSLYYAYLPRPPSEQSVRIASVPELVSNGAPMRNIAACDSCHNAGYIRTGTPYLEGQPYTYLRAQLLAFKTNARRNDLNQQMRNIARQMTLEEVDAVARYYASR